MREDLLTSILAELNAPSAATEACAVLSPHALMLPSLLPPRPACQRRCRHRGTR